MRGTGTTLTALGNRRKKRLYRKRPTSDKLRMGRVGVSCGGGCGCRTAGLGGRGHAFFFQCHAGLTDKSSETALSSGPDNQL